MERFAVVEVLEDIEKLSDQDLVQGIQDGAPNTAELFAILHKRYHKRIEKYLRKYIKNLSQEDYTDILQEGFLKALKGINSLAEPQYFSSWLHSIVRNAGYDLIRYRKTEKRNLKSNDYIDSVSFVKTREEDPLHSVMQVEGSHKLREALDELPQDISEVLRLRYWELMDYEEIAKTLEVRVGTIRSRLSRGKEKIRELLEIGGFSL